MNFDTVGIVCEYNPFHFGHKYHIESTKKLTSCKNVVCIMSGSVVQRGECAIFDKWQRAKYAVESGADLVIELPAYYVLQSADIFALGAVKLLDSIKVVDALSFGSECGDIEIIKKIAVTMTDNGNEYDRYIKEYIKSGMGYPKAAEKALLSCLPQYKDIISKPNNTLAVSYVKAINSIKSNLIPITVKRDNDYHSDISNDNFLSASEIRKKIENKSDISKYSPDYSKENIYSLYNAESFILGYLRTLSPEDISGIKGSEDGLSNLIINSAKKACTLDELIGLCTNKRYTLHRIKRFILSSILGINYDENPDYVRILAIGQNGKGLLKEIKEKTDINIVTKAADYKGMSKMFETDINATDFASLCSSDISKRITGLDFITSPYIKRDGF